MRRIDRIRGLLASLVVLGMLMLAPSAYAIYGPVAGGFGANIVSVDNASNEQANAATTDADISANGQYVVFQTKATNFFEGDGETQQEKEAAEPPGTVREGGIFRYDRTTGALELVASGNLLVSEGKEAGKVLVRGAENPSVSAEGRYAVFFERSRTGSAFPARPHRKCRGLRARHGRRARAERCLHTRVRAERE